MKKILTFTAISILGFLIISSCNNRRDVNDNVENDTELKTIDEPLSDVEESQELTNEASGKQEVDSEKQAVPSVKEIAVDLALGEKIYMEKCIVCHQADGKGVAGTYPPLSNSDFLLKDKVQGAIQALKGSHKRMIVNGEIYEGKMPPQDVTKEEAVAVINYILNNFGNDWGTISIDEVNFKLEDEEEVDDIPFDTEKVIEEKR